MLALEAKRGVEATLERVYKATGNTMGRLIVTWTGTTAGIRTEGSTTHIMFPGVDETKPVEQSLFNELIGYALHELGHKWFTQDAPWDGARRRHGAYVSALINGLEDPRIEQCVIKSGYAPNAESLFDFLTNQVLRKSGYVEPDDFKNIPFMLAIEGRRLHGYSICVPSIVDASPYRDELRWALQAAHVATDTATIVDIAVKLYAKLRKKREQQQQQPQQQQPKQQPKQQGGQGEQGQQQEQQPGKGAQTGEDGAGDAETDGAGGGEQSPEQRPSNGHASSHAEPVGRDPEPTEHIQGRCEAIKSEADSYRSRPHVGKPVFAKFELI